MKACATCLSSTTSSPGTFDFHAQVLVRRHHRGASPIGWRQHVAAKAYATSSLVGTIISGPRNCRTHGTANRHLSHCRQCNVLISYAPNGLFFLSNIQLTFSASCIRPANGSNSLFKRSLLRRTNRACDIADCLTDYAAISWANHCLE